MSIGRNQQTYDHLSRLHCAFLGHRDKQATAIAIHEITHASPGSWEDWDANAATLEARGLWRTRF